MNLMLLAAAVAAQVAQGGLETTIERANPTIALARVAHKGAPALRLLDRPEEGLDPIVLLPIGEFRNGVIEAEVAGLPSPHASPAMRGFIGIAFRVQKDPSRYEAFYIRPTNGRAGDQLRRNHAIQYIGMPDYPWDRLRKETPGAYESYADMVTGEWTRLRIEVEEEQARLYVGGADQPSLIVNDLKLGPDASGGVGLWSGAGTEGYFRNVKVTNS